MKTIESVATQAAVQFFDADGKPVPAGAIKGDRKIDSKVYPVLIVVSQGEPIRVRWTRRAGLGKSVSNMDEAIKLAHAMMINPSLRDNGPAMWLHR